MAEQRLAQVCQRSGSFAFERFASEISVGLVPGTACGLDLGLSEALSREVKRGPGDRPCVHICGVGQFRHDRRWPHVLLRIVTDRQAQLWEVAEGGERYTASNHLVRISTDQL